MSFVNTKSISIDEARKLVLKSQAVFDRNKTGNAKQATLDIIEHLGYIQIDTISVIERAHHHTLWNRNSRYKKNHLDKLLSEYKIFEYWSHAAAYLPLSDYRFSLPLKQKISAGEKRWYCCNEKIKKEVYTRIKNEGPLQSKDFENHGQQNLPMWEWKPAKYALDQLFMEGSIMVKRRENFQKVYDLTERVLPQTVDTRFPNDQEMAQHLAKRFLQSNGIGKVAEITYLRKGMKEHIQTAIDDLVEAGEVVAVQCKIGGNIEIYYTLVSSLEMLNQPIARSKLKILSPFDNLVIQRKRLLTLFDFDYQLECYVPTAKRRYGYFVLPVLWQGRMVARVDCKADRRHGVLHINKLYTESKLKSLDRFFQVFGKSLKEFAEFNNCKTINPLTNHRKKLLAFIGD